MSGVRSTLGLLGSPISLAISLTVRVVLRHGKIGLSCLLPGLAIDLRGKIIELAAKTD